MRALRLSVLIGAVIACAAPGSALAAPTACGETITTDTTLHADLTNCPGDGLVIGADDITLDVNGHTIDGRATPGTSSPDAGIRLLAHHGVRIENGTVREFGTGVLLDAAARNALRRLTVTRTGGRGIQLQNGSDGNLIESSDASGTGRTGIALLSSDRNVVRQNTARGNPFDGLVAFTSDRNVVLSNDFSNNIEGIGFADASNDNVIAGNAISGNADDGVRIDAGNRNVVRGNRVSANGDDVLVSGDGNAVIANLVTDALGCGGGCGAGIAAEGGTGNIIAANTVARTDLEGIRVNEFEGAGGAPTIGTVVRANIVRAAGSDGIAVATSTDPNSLGGTVKDTLVEANIVSSSGHDGINVASAATTLTRNLAVRNGALGIGAVPGVIDGGGNRAVANGDERQCVNVFCS